MKANLNWNKQFHGHLRFLENLVASGSELPCVEVTLPEDILEIFRASFPGYEKAVFFDLETTGLDPTQDLITQISAVSIQVKNGKLETFNSYIRLPDEEKIPENITALTGITNEFLIKSGKTESDALRAFGEWIGEQKTLFAGHNIQFDLCFLLEGLKRYGDTCADALEKAEKSDYFDTLTVYKDRRPSPHNLAVSLKTYGLDFTNSHHALEDAGGALSLTYFMGFEKRNLTEYINRIGINPKYGLIGYEIGRIHYYCQEGIIAPENGAPMIKGRSM